MTKGVGCDEAFARSKVRESELRSMLPLVSVIVLNFNNENFIVEAVESVLRQSYSKIECVVVDDASTDRSCEILEELQPQVRSFKVHRRYKNGGQGAAALDGLAITSGAFVHFLDGDDLLHPSFIATHIAVNLRLRFAAGFSCSDMVQFDSDQTLTTCDGNISRFLASKKTRLAQIRAGTADEAFASLGDFDDRVFAVNPWERTWPWSATSAMVFRRNALALFADAPSLNEITRSMDCYFCRGINAVSGSVIIDMPLSFYRLHATNFHFKRMPLDRTICFDRAGTIKTTNHIIDILVSHVLKSADRFEAIFWKPKGYVHLLKHILDQYPHKKAFVSVILIRHFVRLRKVFGTTRLAAWIVGIRY